VRYERSGSGVEVSAQWLGSKYGSRPGCCLVLAVFSEVCRRSTTIWDMSCAIELAFDFSWGANTAATQLRGPYPPFNSGTWTFSYDGSYVRCNFSGQPSPVRARSVVLSLSAKGMSGYDTSNTARSVTSAEFPPGRSWSIACAPSSSFSSKYAYVVVSCVAKLVVILIEDAAVVDSPAERSDGLEQVASHATGELSGRRKYGIR
jgi:hypothetical protein